MIIFPTRWSLIERSFIHEIQVRTEQKFRCWIYILLPLLFFFMFFFVSSFCFHFTENVNFCFYQACILSVLQDYVT